VPDLKPEDQKKQEHYRDARFLNKYDDIWQTVGKCVFCDLNEKYVFFEENGIVMTISLYAYIDGHFMIVPRRHIRSSKELSQLEWETIRKFTYIAKKLIKDVHGIKGMQLVQKDGADAQSTVEHIHFHCIPFDAPDLCQWNYRQLKYTPLENVSLYKKARKDILKNDRKFTEKYLNPTGLPIVVDALLINKKGELLLQERTEETKLSPDILTPPGGTVENYYSTLEDELVRELQEELHITLDPSQFQLLASRMNSRNVVRHSKALNAKYPQNVRYMWNTYIVDNFVAPNTMKPGDDCASLVWVPLTDISDHPRVSIGIKQAVQAYTEKRAL
jgi:histidine triad (HIT) family protein